MSVNLLHGDQVRDRGQHATDLRPILLDDHVADPLEPERAQRLTLVLVPADARPDLLDLESCRHHCVTSARARSRAAGVTCSTVSPRRAATVSGSTSILSAATV